MEDKPANEKIYTFKDIGYFRLTPRSAENYYEIFAFSPKDLKPNAIVLDAGSGTEQEFAKSLATSRPDIRVISLDPSLALPSDDEALKEMGISYDIIPLKSPNKPDEKTTQQDREQRVKNKFGEVVAAIAPHLPFKDQTFDYIFDNHGPFMYFSPDKNELERYVAELLRITKPGGNIDIYPLDTYSEALMNNRQKLKNSRQRIQDIMQDLGMNNFNVFTAPDFGRINRLGIKITKV